MKFFHVLAPEISQNAPGLKEVILTAFKHDLEFLIGKLVFCRQLVHLLTVVQTQFWSGYFSKITHGFASFGASDIVWNCLWKAHWRNSWSQWACLWDIYIHCIQTPQKNTESWNIYAKKLKGMYGAWMKPLIALGTRWIDHRVRAMGG